MAGGHLQTILPAISARAPMVHYTRERWESCDSNGLPDGDFVDIDWIADRNGQHRWIEGAPLVVMFHGLEGSSQSGYCRALMSALLARGWNGCVPHFRGCSGELNRGPRAYHSGDFQEIGWILARLRAREPAPLAGVVGISLGGNALMCWAAEAGESAAQVTRAVASVCSPLDLAAAGEAIDRGFNRQVYARMFLATMKPKALAKLAQHPGLFDAERLRAARTLHEFDDVFTGPLHGFAGTDDYWARAAAKPRLRSIRIPALALNARNDPFIPAQSLPRAGEVGRVALWQPDHGGHVGFAHGSPPGHLQAMPQAVLDWMAAQ